MKSIGKYNSVSLFEITNQDISALGGKKNGYVLGDILGFAPEEEFPVLGYEEYVAGSKQEIQELINRDDNKSNKRVATKEEVFVPNPLLPGTENNCGYYILEHINIDKTTSYVIAENKTAPNPFVTWQCKTNPVTGEKDYFWGKYTNTYLSALQNLCNGILAWTRNAELSIEDPGSVLKGIRTYDENDIIVRGMGNLSTNDLSEFNNNFHQFERDNATNAVREPKDLISDFLSTSGYHTASVTPFENDPSHLCATDLLFNSRSGMFEHSDAWVVATLNVLAEKKCEFAITSEGVQLPASAREVFNPSESRRAEQIVMGAYLRRQERTQVNIAPERVLGR
ncbi:MAG: hypothetical protein WCG21_14485 [Eubacteriales bacterium]